jgi:DNA-binding XRE family transcriptional regulator
VRKTPRIHHVASSGEWFRLNVAWNNGENAHVDVSELVSSYRNFAPLRDDPSLFEKVRTDDGGRILRWDKGVVLPAGTLWRLALEQKGEAMTSEEFRTWRAFHHLSMSKAAEILGISRRMVAYYETGERIIPKTIRLACKGASLELGQFVQ